MQQASILRHLLSGLTIASFVAVQCLSPSLAHAESISDAIKNATNNNTRNGSMEGAYFNPDAASINTGASITNANTQQTAQQGTAKTNHDGAQAAGILGIAAIAGGSIMIAIGMPTCPQGGGCALVAAGAALVVAGGLGLNGAQKMNDNGNAADGLASNLNSTTPGIVAGTPISNSTGASVNGNSGISIDPSLLNDGKIGSLMNDFQGKTGLSSADLVNGLKNGENIADILANSPNAKQNGMTADGINAALDSAAAGTPLSANDVMSKLGLSNGDLLAGIGTAGGGGSAGGRTPAGDKSDSNPLLNMFGDTGANAKAGKTADANANAAVKNPNDNKDAANTGQVTGVSIFDIVHHQYEKKSPLMLGIQRKTDQYVNPFDTSKAEIDLKGI